MVHILTGKLNLDIVQVFLEVEMPLNLLSRDQEAYGVMWMLWNSLTMVHLHQHPKNNCILNLSMACEEVIHALVLVPRYLVSLLPT